MKEADFSRDFIDTIKMKFPYYWGKKIHGHEMQDSSIPDNLFCINAIFVAIEFKVQRDGKISITPGQIREINEIKNANGIGLIIAYDENKGKILIRDKRLDYKKLFLRSNITNARKYIRIDWDFEFSDYETAVDIISLMVENK